MTELICIVCPKGCHLKVDENNGFAVTGNSCEKGEAYGKAELMHPVRTLTTTVKVLGGELPRCPVRTASPLPKDKMFEAMAVIDRLAVAAPVQRGQVLIADLLGTGADLIATRDIGEK